MVKRLHQRFSRGVRKYLRTEKARIRRAYANDPKQAEREVALLITNFIGRKGPRKE